MSVEHGTLNPGVVGSSPTLGVLTFLLYYWAALLWLLGVHRCSRNLSSAYVA
jgi:hypothetical protein